VILPEGDPVHGRGLRTVEHAHAREALDGGTRLERLPARRVPLGRDLADRAVAGDLPGASLSSGHVDAEQVDGPAVPARLPEQRATQEAPRAGLGHDDRPGDRQRAPDVRVVRRVDERAPDPVRHRPEAPGEPATDGVGVEEPVLRAGGSACTCHQRALAGAGHAGDQKHITGGVAEDHARSFPDAGQATLRATSTTDEERPATLRTMRRMLLLAGSVAVLALVAVVALAPGGPAAKTKGAALTPQAADAHVPTTGPFAVAARGESAQNPGDDFHRTVAEVRQRQARRRQDRVHDRIARALAGRLDVSPQILRFALGETKARLLSRFVDRGVLEAAERITLEACLNDGVCRSREIRPIIRKLRADLTRTDTLVDRKEELLHALSRTLEIDEDRIEDALHTQLDVSLANAARFGAISPETRRQVVACFDEPETCNGQVLREAFWQLAPRGER
jgi:hypothetical protein